MPLLKNSFKPVELFSPINGRVIETSGVNNYTIKNNILGQGVAIIPREGKVYAPIDGEISFVYPAKHVFGIREKSGVDLIVHFGLDTGKLHGEGFSALVKTGDKVKKGDLILDVDLDFIRSKADATSVLLITNLGDKQVIKPNYGDITTNEIIMVIDQEETK